ncbi:MAG TPA: hypothetical protein ACQGQI_00305 [Xylella sp.]
MGNTNIHLNLLGEADLPAHQDQCCICRDIEPGAVESTPNILSVLVPKNTQNHVMCAGCDDDIFRTLSKVRLVLRQRRFAAGISGAGIRSTPSSQKNSTPSRSWA